MDNIQKKKCSTCEQEKILDDFHKSKYKSFGRQSSCKECCSKKAEVYRNKPGEKEKAAEYKKQWRIDNAEKIKLKDDLNADDLKKRRQLIYQKNKDKIKKRNYEYRKKRLATDPLFKLSYTVSTLVRNSFKRKFTTKSKRTLEILGCTYDEFYKYLESKFDDKMTWENQGTYWVIDHIKPIALAQTIDEVYELNHYTNLQPMSAVDNTIKGKKYDG